MTKKEKPQHDDYDGDHDEPVSRDDAVEGTTSSTSTVVSFSSCAVSTSAVAGARRSQPQQQQQQQRGGGPAARGGSRRRRTKAGTTAAVFARNAVLVMVLSIASLWYDRKMLLTTTTQQIRQTTSPSSSLQQHQPDKEDEKGSSSCSSVLLPSSLSSLFSAPDKTTTNRTEDDVVVENLWLKNLQRVWTASQLFPGNDGDAAVRRMFDDVLFSTTSTEQQTTNCTGIRLRNAVQNFPHNRDELQRKSLERVVQIVEKRRKWLLEKQQQSPEAQDQTPEPPPPLHVLVLGGSVTHGSGCVSPQAKKKHNMKETTCAWPNRFEILINKILLLSGDDDEPLNKDSSLVIKVHNLAVGGTSTEQGNVFLKYWMYPEEIRRMGPDVVVNAYSTNDSDPPWHILQQRNKNQKKDKKEAIYRHVYARTVRQMQQFVRTVLTSRPCRGGSSSGGGAAGNSPPLIVAVNDFLGDVVVHHQQRRSGGNDTTATTATTTPAGVLAHDLAVRHVSRHYGTVYISAADVMRGLLPLPPPQAPPRGGPNHHHNHHQQLVNAKYSDGRYLYDRHFHEPGHAAMAWIVAYGITDVLYRTMTNIKDCSSSSSSSPRDIITTAAAANNHATTVIQRGDDDETAAGSPYRVDHHHFFSPLLRLIPPPLPVEEEEDVENEEEAPNEVRVGTASSGSATIEEGRRAEEEPASTTRTTILLPELAHVDCSAPSGGGGGDSSNNNNSSSSERSNPCVVAWIAGPIGVATAQSLRKAMKPYVVQNVGWTASVEKSHGYKNKLGWEATRRNATFVMSLQNLPRDVGVVTIMYMKSYGSKWDESQARFDIEYETTTPPGAGTSSPMIITVSDAGANATTDGGNNNVTTTTNNPQTKKEVVTGLLTGYHASNTSISYTEEIYLPSGGGIGGARRGTDLTLKVELVRGTTFKIMAMMFCSW